MLLETNPDLFDLLTRKASGFGMCGTLEIFLQLWKGQDYGERDVIH